MSGSKFFDRFAIASTALMLAVTLLFMNGASWGLTVMAHTMGYETRLFDSSRVHTLDIVMNDWDDFLLHATSEEYYTANVIIDGESYRNVGIRAKGNTSLTTVTTLGSQRYSFKIEFDHYDSSNSYYGLDKLCLNNLIQDSTMMKDYLTYTMMGAFGVPASLCSYVYITVNGEDWGLYLAVEGVEESFLERNYGSNYGALYKPDSSDLGGGRGNGMDFKMDAVPFEASNTTTPFPNEATPPSSGETHQDFPDFSAKQEADPVSGMGTSDVKLQYTDDELSSYSNIWDNAKTELTKTSQEALITALKKLSANEEIEAVLDIEQVIRYFIVHNYVCNGDSYTGSMVHNYYLYEENGKLSMIPWDYNLAFGTFQSSNATQTLNTPIDAPVENGTGEDRPMWNWIVSNESYTELYHTLFSDFLSQIDMVSIIDQTYSLIQAYVERDPTSFYSDSEFEQGVKTLRQFCLLRSESISKQLAEGDTRNGTTYVDGSTIQLSDMGSMNHSMNPDESIPSNEMPSFRGPQSHDSAQEAGTVPDMQPDNTPQPPENIDSSTDYPSFSEFIPEEQPQRDFTQRPDLSSSQPSLSPASDHSSWILLAVSMGILAIGLIIAKKYPA